MYHILSIIAISSGFSPRHKESTTFTVNLLKSPEFSFKLQSYYCELQTVLIPETTFVCAVNIRQKREDNKITNEGALITSEMEKDFSLEIPQDSFEGEAVLSLTVSIDVQI